MCVVCPFRELAAKAHREEVYSALAAMRKSPRRLNERFARHTLVSYKRVVRQGLVMLDNVSEQIRECFQHAEDCARKLPLRMPALACRLSTAFEKHLRTKPIYCDLCRNTLGIGRNAGTSRAVSAKRR